MLPHCLRNDIKVLFVLVLLFSRLDCETSDLMGILLIIGGGVIIIICLIGGGVHYSLRMDECTCTSCCRRRL